MRKIKKWYGVTYWYIDDNTRIRLGYTLRYSGTTYTLQRKKIKWTQTAWTFKTIHSNLGRAVDYLKWYENYTIPDKV